MNSPAQTLAEHYRETGGFGASSAGYCYEGAHTITPRNRRRGAWCEICELDDGLSRDGAASAPRKGSLYAQALLIDGLNLDLPVAPSGGSSGLTKTGGALKPRR
jgi:hypothetical protein